MSSDRHTIVNPPTLAGPAGYSNGIITQPGRLLFLSGQIGWDRDGRMVGVDLTKQFDQALANVLEVVIAAGGTAESVAKMTIYVVSKTEYQAARRTIGEVYRSRMGRHYPAMTLVEVSALLEPGAKVEIDAIAALSGDL